MAYRIDLTHLDAARPTPSGGMAIEGRLTRTGILTYRNPDGSTRRELRHPDEVFHADSLASLAAAPLTVGHPGRVTPATWKSLSVGHVGEPRRDGVYVASKVYIQDGQAVASVAKGDLRELSCGYDCAYDPTPGVYNGEHYDGVQRNIRYNHVGIGPKGWGRAGSEVALRMDAIVGEPELAYSEPDRYDTDNPELTSADGEGMELKEILEKLEAANALSTTLQTKCDSLRAELDETKGKLDAASKDLETARKDASEEVFAAKVAARVSLVEKARGVLGSEFKADGKSDAEIMAEVCKSSDKDLVCDGLSIDYLRGRFDHIVSSRKVADVANAALVVATADPTPPVVEERKDSYEARVAAAAAKRANAWKGVS